MLLDALFSAEARLTRRRAWRPPGLAGRLLALTVVVVLMGEVLVFAPALAGFHAAWLQDRINLAQTAALALEASPDREIGMSLQRELLANAEVERVALRRGDERELVIAAPAAAETEGAPVITYDYRDVARVERLSWAFESFFAPEGRILRVLAQPRFESGEFIEVMLAETPLKRAMGSFALRTFLLATLVSLSAGAIVYLTLNIAFVRPMRRLTAAIERFRDAPEAPSMPFERNDRSDEIGRAEQAAADMADQIRQSLRQRERLAQLGGAVARIAHDLRNMLSTAQLVTERLALSADPTVRLVAPRLERAIGRAAGLASATLQFGRVEEAAPVLRPVRLEEAAQEAAQDALAPFPNVSAEVVVDPSLVVLADPDHLHRILVNLLRNAGQALAGRINPRVRLRGVRAPEGAVLEVIDNGPGVSPETSARLFEPFSAKAQGTGLGLAIARELARAMGGEVRLVRTSAEGALFAVTLPAA